MTHALNAAEYQPPHVPAGSPSGGQFGPTGGSGSASTKTPAKSAPAKTAPKKTTHPAARPAGHDNGTLGFDAKTNHGTGYGSPNGDPRVHRLQQALNRLGMTDAAGHPLKLDGKLGPRTTAAVEKAQKRLGLPQDGKVTPALLAALTAAKTPAKAPAKHVPAPAKHAPAKAPAKHSPAKPATPPAKHVQKVAYAAADPQHPYGPETEIDYADPGMQPDGKARYPLDSADHCKSAWRFINMPENAAKYTPEQVAEIKKKILDAGKEYGLDFAMGGHHTMAAADLKGVEVARPGTWKLSSGELTVTPQMLADAARYAQRPGARPSPVKLGHTDPRFSGDGEPALGWLGNLRVEDDNGPVLKGDITGMPDWLAAAAPDHWPDRSMEGWADFTADDGETYALVVDGLALLGVTPPGMSSIRSLRDLPQALGVAASARIVARAPQTPALEAEAPTKKEIHVDPVKIREALDLQSDASEDEVMAALVHAGLAPPAPDPAPVQASLFDPPTTTPTAAPAREMAGTMRVDASAWEAAQDRIKRLEAAADKQRVAERDQIIAKAVQDGKFAPARREHWVRLWDADPEGAREAIDGLARNVIPVMASGYSDADGEELDREYVSLFPPTTRKGA